MRNSLSGKGVLITGGSSGIGLETAQRLVRAGARVFITGLPPDADVRAAAARISTDPRRIGYAVMDSLDPDSVNRASVAAQEFLGRIDVLVNNAGVASQFSVTDHDLDRAEAEMRINYFGMFRVTQAVLPGMLAHGQGTIVNVASTLARVPGPTQANYSATKAAIAAFSSSLRGEVEDHGVHVTVFVPGLTSTGMIQKLNVEAPYLLDPGVVAKHLVKSIRKHPAEYVTGLSYRSLVLMGRLMPETTRKLVKRYYR